MPLRAAALCSNGGDEATPGRATLWPGRALRRLTRRP